LARFGIEPKQSLSVRLSAESLSVWGLSLPLAWIAKVKVDGWSVLSADVPDGATQRHSRMMELLTFINLSEPHGVTITQIQSYMLTVFGLKFKTTSEMVKELTLAGIIKADAYARYHLAEKQRSAMKRLAAQEEKESSVIPLLKRIDNIKDPAVREKALKLYEELMETLPSSEDSQQ